MVLELSKPTLDSELAYGNDTDTKLFERINSLLEKEVLFIRNEISSKNKIIEILLTEKSHTSLWWPRSIIVKFRIKRKEYA